MSAEEALNDMAVAQAFWNVLGSVISGLRDMHLVPPDDLAILVNEFHLRQQRALVVLSARH